MKQPSVCEDKALLVAFLYDECDPADRDRMEAHLAACATCGAELDALRGTRAALGEWAPPEPALGFRVVREEVKPSRWAWAWPRVPVWAQAAAAVLVLAAAAGIANLDVTVAKGGVTIRTGWSQAAPQLATQRPIAAAPNAPTREEVAALVRQEIAKLPVSAPAPSPAQARPASAASVGADTVQFVKAAIAESESRQRGEYDRQLAARFVDFQRDMSSQQRAELVRLQQGFVQLQGRTSADLASLRQAQDRVQSYLVRVANVQEIR